MANLPYVLTVNALEKLLEKIQIAAVPERFSQDFVTTKLGIKGGSGRALIPFVKKMGFVAGDGQPTARYHEFRNTEKSGGAIAAAIRDLYAPLFEMNEYAHDLSSTALKNLIVEATGSEPASSAVQKTVATFKCLAKMADFEASSTSDSQAANIQPAKEYSESREDFDRTEQSFQKPPADLPPPPPPAGEGINLSYTINLNLPATSDIEVFNALFKSLKKHLIQGYTMDIVNRVKAFGMTNMLLESDLTQIEREYGLDLGRDRAQASDVESRYFPQFDESLRKEAAAMASHYELFYCLEKNIRQLITDVFEGGAGDDWWNERVPQQVRENAKKAIKRERESAVTPRSESSIDYTTFGELGEIIKSNWDLFGSVFQDPKGVEKVMSSLNSLRNPIAHCSPLAEDEVARLELSMKDWFRIVS